MSGTIPPPSLVVLYYSWPRLAPVGTDAVNIISILGLASVGNDAVKHASHCMSYQVDNQHHVFFFFWRLP